MLKVRKIELLAPAKDLECGIEAVNHGADAIYIGAPKFSARSAAGNTLEDIRNLADYAHLFDVKIYVAINTILTDKELQETEKLIWQLYSEARIDAIIIQDYGITMLNLPPIPLHASTQMDTRTPERAKFLEEAGFKQIVLARELTINEIKEISSSVNTPLEAFVHGALCVCYSGQCYLSQALSARSANKGSCAQYCRLPYTLVDSNGEEVIAKKHLLSMKDLNLSEDMEDMLEAGISSFKIEGRLKDVSYVKNTIAYYRNKLDSIIDKYPQYVRSSSGKSTYTFIPNLKKSFNRGFTKYFLNDRAENIWSVDSPKSIGEHIGTVTEITTKYIRIRGNAPINNGDGLCFFNSKKELEGIHVNRVEGDLIFPISVPEIKKGTHIYRNSDHEFERLLSKKSAERKISADIIIDETKQGHALTIEDEDGNLATINFDSKKELAQKDQSDNIRNNLSKTGNTIFKIQDITINWTKNWFIPASTISDWRRQITDKLLSVRKINYRNETTFHKPTNHPFPIQDITYLGNVMNEKSKQFYIEHQSQVSQYAFERQAQEDVPLMFTRHCIKYSLGWCPQRGAKKHPFKEPFFLIYNNTRLRLAFDCKNCEMKVYQD